SAVMAGHLPASRQLEPALIEIAGTSPAMTGTPYCAAPHHSRRTNSRPSSFFAHSTMGALLRKERTAGATAFGSALPSETRATTPSHSPLKATESRRSSGLSSDITKDRLRPLIQPTLTGLPGPRGRTFGLTRSVSATRSSSLSSDTPVEQLQKPIFGRMNRSILAP